MRVFVADFLCVNAHKCFNNNVIDSLRNIADVVVADLNEFYDQKFSDVTYEKFNVKLLKPSCIKTRINSLLLMVVQFVYLFKNRKNYDAVVCLGFDIFATLFSIGFVHLFKRKIYLFHHKNIDELENPFKRSLFKGYQNLYTHIVFEESFALHLKKMTGLGDSSVKVLPHPIKCFNDKMEIFYDCVGLCNSNSQDFVENLFRLLEQDDFLKLRFVIRGRKKVNKNTNLTVIDSFLSSQEYREYILSSKCVFVALPSNYKNRLSGSIYDAFSMKKKVYTTSKIYYDLYKTRYPGLCSYVTSAKELILKVSQEQNCCLDFESFIRDHSIEMVAKKMKKILEENQ